MRSSLFKGLALLSALSVLVALLIHAGCSKPGAVTAEPGAAASPVAVSAPPVEQAAPAPGSASAAPSVIGAGNGAGNSEGFMGASKSGAIFHGKDLGKGRDQAGTSKTQAPSQNAAPPPVQR
jgi:hypothetical protein